MTLVFFNWAVDLMDTPIGKRFRTSSIVLARFDLMTLNCCGVTPAFRIQARSFEATCRSKSRRDGTFAPGEPTPAVVRSSDRSPFRAAAS